MSPDIITASCLKAQDLAQVHQFTSSEHFKCTTRTETQTGSGCDFSSLATESQQLLEVQSFDCVNV